jgi:uncharacterized protein involved in exopolysaccharide biosynthesis
MTESRSLADQLGTAWRRRRRQIVILFILCAGASGVVISRLKPTFRATAVVVVDDSTTPPEYVRSMVTGDTETKLRTLRERLLGHDVLAEAVKREKLYPELAKLGVAGQVAKLRKDLDIKIDGTSTFSITYESNDRNHAARVVNQLANLAVESHAKTRVARSRDAVAYLSAELAKVEPPMLAAERDLRQFRLANKGWLPEEVETNLREMDQSRLLLGRSQEVLATLTARRRSHLVERQRTLRHDEEELQKQLLEARSRYTPDHPEVRRLEAEHASAVSRRKRQEGEVTQQVLNSPEVRDSDREIADIKASIGQLQKKATLHADRVAKTAKISDQLALLLHNYTQLRDRHQTLKTRLFEAELALGLETRAKDARFAVAGLARPPAEPVRPNKPEMGMLALLASLLVSLSVAVVRESLDRSVRDPGEVRAAFGPVPVLACVPRMGRVRPLSATALTALTGPNGTRPPGPLARRA